MSELKQPKWKLVCVDDHKDTEDLMIASAMAYPHVMFFFHRTQAGAERRLLQYEYNFDAVVIDLALQGESGREMTANIRKKEPNFGHPKRIEIFWYTAWPVNLEDDYDPFTQTYYACEVRKLFRKPYPAPDLIEEVLKMSGIPLEDPDR